MAIERACAGSVIDVETTTADATPIARIAAIQRAMDIALRHDHEAVDRDGAGGRRGTAPAEHHDAERVHPGR